VAAGSAWPRWRRPATGTRVAKGCCSVPVRCTTPLVPASGDAVTFHQCVPGWIPVRRCLGPRSSRWQVHAPTRRVHCPATAPRTASTTARPVSSSADPPSGPTQRFADWNRGASSELGAEGLTICVGSLDGIIASKRAAGRERDRRALPYLTSLGDVFAGGIHDLVVVGSSPTRPTR